MINKNEWYRFSQNKGGHAIDFMKEFYGLSFAEAVKELLGEEGVGETNRRTAKEDAGRQKVCPIPLPGLELPERNESCEIARKYLIEQRKLSEQLVDQMIEKGDIYESKNYHNVVFVGMDADGKPRYANQRGIGSDFIGDANGSDKHYSFGIPAATASDTLHLFESAVDLLSYGTLQKLDGKDWRGENLLSLAGVYKPRAKIEESSLPAALVWYLAEHPHIRRVVLRLDNDATGRIAAETVKTLLPRKYAVTVDIQPPPQGKDYNDCLCMQLGLPITKRRERSKER